MRVLGWLFVGLLLLPLMQGAATLLVALSLAMAAVAALTAPRETLAFMVCLAFIGAFSAHPLAGLLVLALLIWARRGLS